MCVMVDILQRSKIRLTEINSTYRYTIFNYSANTHGCENIPHMFIMSRFRGRSQYHLFYLGIAFLHSVVVDNVVGHAEVNRLLNSSNNSFKHDCTSQKCYFTSKDKGNIYHLQLGTWNNVSCHKRHIW